MRKYFCKYSIIIPTYNGLEYLPTCIETIVNQDYSDYELIISDDHSNDGTKEYLEALNHPNVKVIYPEKSLSMTEHWEWALSHAKGEWQIFVGQDDGLQPYFFELADRLTIEASEKRLRSIMSSRAYFFWPGCQHVYGDTAVNYRAEKKVKVLDFKWEGVKALLGLQDYFELPQMYTTALFHIDLLNDARAKQAGKVFSCHPQDANLAAVAFSLEKRYLKSYTPLGWVGSSPKSAGMAISEAVGLDENSDKEKSSSLKDIYLDKIDKSDLKYHEWAGDFSFGNNGLYFWQALLMTEVLRSEGLNNKIKSSFFKYALFSRVLYRKLFPKNKSASRNFNTEEFKRLLSINGCNYNLIKVLFVFIVILSKPLSLITRFIKKLRRVFSGKAVSFTLNWEDDSALTMVKASSIVEREKRND